MHGALERMGSVLVLVVERPGPAARADGAAPTLSPEAAAGGGVDAGGPRHSHSGARRAIIAQVKIRAKTDVALLQWPVETLTAHLRGSASVAAAMNAVVGADVAVKLLRQSRVVEVRMPVCMPRMRAKFANA